RSQRRSVRYRLVSCRNSRSRIPMVRVGWSLAWPRAGLLERRAQKAGFVPAAATSTAAGQQLFPANFTLDSTDRDLAAATPRGLAAGADARPARAGPARALKMTGLSAESGSRTARGAPGN